MFGTAVIITYTEPFDSALCFKSFEKMKVISLYWFAAQHRTSTFSRQKFGLFYLQLSAEFNELTLNVKVRGRRQKMPKTKKNPEKRGYACFGG